MTNPAPPRLWHSKLPIPGDPLVSIIVPVYEPNRCDLEVLINCFQRQTYQNFEVIFVYDGPEEHGFVKCHITDKYEGIDDERFRYYETSKRSNDFGHTPRQLGFKQAEGDYIGTTNQDNYYVPVYFESMLHEAVALDLDIVLCDMVHSHRDYSYLYTRPVIGEVDAGCWLAKAGIVKATPWRDKGFAGDGVFVMDIAQSHKVGKVHSVLFVHN